MKKECKKREHKLLGLWVGMCVLCGGGLLFAQQAEPLFDIGGVKIAPQDAAHIVADVAQVMKEVSRDTQAEFDARLAKLEQEKRELANKKDRGIVRQEEYIQAVKDLDKRSEYIYDEMHQAAKNGQQIGNNVQQALLTGWNMIVKEREEASKRKTEVAVVAAKSAVENEGALEQLKTKLAIEFEPKNMLHKGLFYGLTATGIVGGYYGFSLLYKYLEAKLDVPTMLEETSWLSLKDKIKQWWYGAPIESTLDDVILSPEVMLKVKKLAIITRSVRDKEGLLYRHAIFYGPPGTGKTMIAKIIAKSSDMDYAIFSGSRIAQLPLEKAIQKINEIFDRAEHNGRPSILFIDEADSLLSARTEKSSERAITQVNAILARTNASSSHVMLMLATNHLDRLAPPMRDRIAYEIEISLPGVNERVKMYMLYVKKYFTHVKLSPDINETLWQKVSQKSDGFSGREIEQVVGGIVSEARVLEKDQVTVGLVERILDDKIQQHAKKARGAQEA